MRPGRHGIKITGIETFRLNNESQSQQQMSRFFLAVAAEIRPTIKVLFIFDFVSDPESESEPESESIKSLESEPESESEQPHHDSASLDKSGAMDAL